MIQGIQNLFENIGASGCYLLSIIEGCTRNSKSDLKFDDFGEVVEEFIKKGWLTEDMFVNNPNKICEYFVGKKVSVTIEAEPPSEDDERVLFYVECWYNPRTAYTHFRLHDWDSLKSSVTVKEGSIKSYRVFKTL